MLQLYTTIKNDAPSGVKYAIWKFAGEDFKSGSQLIVNPSRGGHICKGRESGKCVFGGAIQAVHKKLPLRAGVQELCLAGSKRI